MIDGELTEAIIGAAIEMHRQLGPGLLESTYEQCLCYELSTRGLSVQCQVELPVRYKGVLINCGYRVDILVNETVILELKPVEKILPIHEAQLMTYLCLSGKRIGLLLNFNVTVLKDGLIRRVL
jgi:GxxExxY protein